MPNELAKISNDDGPIGSPSGVDAPRRVLSSSTRALLQQSQMLKSFPAAQLKYPAGLPKIPCSHE